MSLIDGKLRTVGKHSLHKWYPVMFKDFSESQPGSHWEFELDQELVQVVPLGHIGSRKIDAIVSIVVGRYYRPDDNLCTYVIARNMSFDAKKCIWRAPCHDPTIHQVRIVCSATLPTQEKTMPLPFLVSPKNTHTPRDRIHPSNLTSKK